MSGLTHHVFRRGMDVALNHVPNDGDAPKDPEQSSLPIWGVVLLLVTVLGGLFALFAVCNHRLD